MLGLVGDVGPEGPSHNAVPGGVVFTVEFLLDEGGDVLLDVVSLEGLGVSLRGGYLGGDVDGVLGHLFLHIGILDHGLSIGGGHFVLFFN